MVVMDAHLRYLLISLNSHRCPRYPSAHLCLTEKIGNHKKLIIKNDFWSNSNLLANVLAQRFVQRTGAPIQTVVRNGTGLSVEETNRLAGKGILARFMAVVVVGRLHWTSRGGRAGLLIRLLSFRGVVVRWGGGRWTPGNGSLTAGHSTATVHRPELSSSVVFAVSTKTSVSTAGRGGLRAENNHLESLDGGLLWDDVHRPTLVDAFVAPEGGADDGQMGDSTVKWEKVVKREWISTIISATIEPSPPPSDSFDWARVWYIAGVSARQPPPPSLSDRSVGGDAKVRR